MAAPPAPPNLGPMLAAFGPVVAAFAGIVAPLATQAQVTGLQVQMQALAATQAQLAAAQAQLAATQVPMQAQLAAMQVQMQTQQAQLIAQIQAVVLPQNAPVIVIAVATARAILTARTRNAHNRRGVAYMVVPRDDGTLPPTWPAGFNRDLLVEGPIGVVDAILHSYGQPNGVAGGGLVARRNALAEYIGTGGV